MPAKAGIQAGEWRIKEQNWIPASAGMTKEVRCEAVMLSYCGLINCVPKI